MGTISRRRIRDAFKKKKQKNLRHWPKFPRPPPSLGTLGHTKLGHLDCFETLSLPIKFGTYVYFFYGFSMIINSESRIETVVLNNENCKIFDQSHQISSLHNSPPPETNENH